MEGWREGASEGERGREGRKGREGREGRKGREEGEGGREGGGLWEGGRQGGREVGAGGPSVMRTTNPRSSVDDWSILPRYRHNTCYNYVMQ